MSLVLLSFYPPVKVVRRILLRFCFHSPSLIKVSVCWSCFSFCSTMEGSCVEASSGRLSGEKDCMHMKTSQSLLQAGLTGAQLITSLSWPYDHTLAGRFLFSLFIPGNDWLSESTLSKLGLADWVVAIQFLQLAAATRSIWCLFDMWTEVVIYLSASHVQKPQRVFDRNRSRPVLPHLGRSDVTTLSSQQVKLKPLCGSSINLPCLLLSTEPWCRCLLSCIS